MNLTEYLKQFDINTTTTLKGRKFDGNELTDKVEALQELDEFKDIEIEVIDLPSDDLVCIKLPFNFQTSKIGLYSINLDYTVSGEEVLLVRVTKESLHKRIFKIDVGNLDKEDIQDYINRVKDRFQRAKSMDEDFFIPIDGEGNPLK